EINRFKSLTGSLTTYDSKLRNRPCRKYCTAGVVNYGRYITILAHGSPMLTNMFLEGSGVNDNLVNVPAGNTQHDSGWVLPSIVFILMAFLSGCAALFICEAMSNIQGNERFQGKVEFTTIAQLFLGKRYHYALQILLYLAMQCVNIASIVLSIQTFDDMFLQIFGKTCGVAFYPHGWMCVSGQSSNNSPFPPGSYFLFTFGSLATAILVVPLGFFNLVQNIKVQIGSFIILLLILVEWVISFSIHGLDPANAPPTSANSTQVVGVTLLNFAFITTVSSSALFDSVKKQATKVLLEQRAILWEILVTFWTCSEQMVKCTMGTDIYINRVKSSHLPFQGLLASKIAVYLFPLVALVTSVPVFTIIIRSNLLRGRICNKYWAQLWASGIPWIIAMVLQTSDQLNMFLNWTSLFLQSTVNFILPFALYFISKKFQASIEEPPASNSNVDNDTFIMYNPEEDRSISIQRRPSARILRGSEDGSKMETYSGGNGFLSKVLYEEDASQPRSPVPQIVLTNAQDDEGLSHTDSCKTIVENVHHTRLTPSFSLKRSKKPSSIITTSDQSSHQEASGTWANTTAIQLEPDETIELQDAIYKHPNNSHSDALTVSSHIRRRSNSFNSTRSLQSIAEIPNSLPIPISPIESTRQVQYQKDKFRAFPSLGDIGSFVLAISAFILIGLAVLFTIIYNFVLLGNGDNVYSS
ncbi:hypothetical protein INT43_008825, partial [Umbelopsis isabellina]